MIASFLLAASLASPARAAAPPRLKPLERPEASATAPAGVPVKSALTKEALEAVLSGRDGSPKSNLCANPDAAKVLGLAPPEEEGKIPDNIICPGRYNVNTTPPAVYDEYYVCRYPETGDYLFLSTHDERFYYLRTDSDLRYLTGALYRHRRLSGDSVPKPVALPVKEGVELLEAELAMWARWAARAKKP